MSIVTVVSPHLDDAVFSIGGSIVAWAREGHDVRVLTVFAGRPDDGATVSAWDALCGFSSEAEATRSRRDEDAAACRVLGARPVWFDFADHAYIEAGTPTDPADNDFADHACIEAGTRADGHAVCRAIQPELVSSDLVVVPGWPRKHPDHLWIGALVDSIMATGPAKGRVLHYAEQPYFAMSGSGSVEPPNAQSGSSADRSAWCAHRLSGRDLFTKVRAMGCYRSQLRPQKTDLLAQLRFELRHRIEWLTCPPLS